MWYVDDSYGLLKRFWMGVLSKRARWVPAETALTCLRRGGIEIELFCCCGFPIFSRTGVRSDVQGPSRSWWPYSGTPRVLCDKELKDLIISSSHPGLIHLMSLLFVFLIKYILLSSAFSVIYPLTSRVTATQVPLSHCFFSSLLQLRHRWADCFWIMQFLLITRSRPFCLSLDNSWASTKNVSILLSPWGCPQCLRWSFILNRGSRGRSWWLMMSSDSVTSCCWCVMIQTFFNLLFVQAEAFGF